MRSYTLSVQFYSWDELYMFLVTAAVVQGLDAFMVTPLRGYMSKIISVEDQGKQ